ncbi:sugar phosphate isomerase/epimerase family protein [Roseiconus lacunae]|uniref:Sugar phosphate isomerase/epimerase n=1 Tax=Roseiconus lacunae TaxID=2605694 RepID=A0ABT7PK20_9BACT|nr:sugar phosphate isomerase/epimerase [Roseiconus lacunae]MDM4016842.1 sugar phosphate isomerase/epimerase [Roseiconus lacunae]
MKRRQFLAAGAALSTLIAKPNWLLALDADNRYRNEIGIQLYTLRNEIGKDVAGTLKAVADAGYKQVEPYGFPGADAMIREAKANGMTVNSSHCNTGSILHPERNGVQPFDALLEKANKHGLTHLVVPYLSGDMRDSLDKYKMVADRCNEAAEKAAGAGVQLAYHNHAFEFKPFEGGKTGYDVFKERFSDQMKFEIDVFWVAVAGVDPAKLIGDLSGRVTQLHLKDLDASVQTPAYDGISKDAFKELGNGVIDMQPILAAAEKAGVAHCHVEQDHSPHPLDSIRESIGYLGKL